MKIAKNQRTKYRITIYIKLPFSWLLFLMLSMKYIKIRNHFYFPCSSHLVLFPFHSSILLFFYFYRLSTCFNLMMTFSQHKTKKIIIYIYIIKPFNVVIIFTHKTHTLLNIFYLLLLLRFRRFNKNRFYSVL